MVEDPYMWRRPGRLGEGAAYDKVFTVAAPLLAGASSALLGIVIGQREPFRWAAPLLIALTLTTILMIVALMLGMVASRHLYSRQDVENWWGPLDRLPQDLAKDLGEEQKSEFAEWFRWMRLALAVFYWGLMLMAVSGVLVLVPPAHEVTPLWRWIAAGSVAVCGVPLGGLIVKSTRLIIRK
ncbi:hypothetical protein [Streptomyces sp. NPDC001678]|uniref:hypothetical protein n=1 Tax=Streptomyces sp. NPDC001678 TaxID=3364599 RepID=UPI0036A32BB0